MKKLIATLLTAALMLGGLTACGGGSSPAGDSPSSSPSAPAPESPDASGAAELTGSVLANGSTSMADVIQVLTEAFRETQSQVTINYTGSGSGAGIEGILAGTCDIGLSSRALKQEELDQGAVPHIIALDGVAVVVNPANPVADLTVEQIADIYTGKITNWSELGGSDAPIAVYGREDGSGTRSAFEEIVGVEGQCAYTNEYGSTGDVIGSVAGNPNAIGYASLSAVNDTVSAVQVNGVAPSEATVKDGTYNIQRPFVMVTKEGVALTDAAQTFLDFASSPEAAEYIAAAGAVAPD